jgi:protease-4
MREFFKYTFASMIGTLLSLTLLVTVSLGGLALLAVSIASASKDSGPKVQDKTVLVLDLKATIRDTKPESSPSEALSEALSDEPMQTLTLRNVLASIDHASQDPKIVGILIKGTNSPVTTGRVNLKEVREALQRFKNQKKPIIAYDVDWSESEYYLGSLADEILINPSGSLEFNGLSSETTFWTGALEKFGLGVQVAKAGKYKSAVEPFTLKGLSAENRQQLQQVFTGIWSDYIQNIAKSRNVDTQALQAIADEKGLLLPSEAVENKLMTGVFYYDQVLGKLKQLTGEKPTASTVRSINLADYGKTAGVEKALAGNQKSSKEVAVVYAEGEIVDGPGNNMTIGGDRLAKQLRELRQNDQVKAIVLRINSRGGSATASEVMAREIVLMKEAKKPIVVSMGSVAASGGYLLAMDADQIWAESNTITGSIGVFGVLFNIQKLGNDNGVNWETVKTGKLADLSTISRPKNPQELAIFQRNVDIVYDRFISHVAESRNLPKEKVNEIAQGRIWTGADAKQIGLVDELGGINSAIQAVVKRANLGDDWKIVEYPKRQSWEERLLERLAGNTTFSKTPDLFSQQLQSLQKQLEVIELFNDPKGIYTRLPFNIDLDGN